MNAAKSFVITASRAAGCGPRADTLTATGGECDEAAYREDHGELSAFMCVQTTTAIDETNDKACMAAGQDQPPRTRPKVTSPG